MIDKIERLRNAEKTSYEAEHHLHNRERWFGKSVDQSGNNWGTLASLTPYTAISAAGAFGSDPDDEALVLGTDDTPQIAGHTQYDPHRIMVTAASNATDSVLRLIYGTGTMADAESAGQYSDVMVTEARKGMPTEIKMPHDSIVAGSTKIWMRLKNATNNATVDFFLGIHEYIR